VLAQEPLASCEVLAIHYCELLSYLPLYCNWDVTHMPWRQMQQDARLNMVFTWSLEELMNYVNLAALRSEF
jgi:hypothetical protein